MLACDLADRIAYVAGIQAEILLTTPRGLRTRDRDLSQGSIQKLRVVHVGAADGDRQRDSTPVDEQTALAPFFSPCRSGSDLRTGLPAELFPSPRRPPATARQCHACRHTRPARPPRASEKIPPCARSESTYAPHWQNRTGAEAPSTGSRCEEHTQSRQIPVAAVLVCVLLRVCAGTCSHLTACAPGPAARSSSTTRPTLSRT